MSRAALMTSPHLLDKLAEFVSENPLDLNLEVSHVVRDSVIDTLGCILVGSGEEVAQLARQAVEPVAGVGAPVFGTPLQALPETAAFVNAVAGHSLDMDDWEIPGNSHASVVILPAILAASADRPLSGRQLCAAFVAGFEAIATLGEASNFEHYARGWHTTGTLACVGAAAAVSRLWGLSPPETSNALSLAISRAAGLTRQFGSHAKPLQAGFAAENGLRAARLARAGLTGQAHVLEGEQGYFALTAHRDIDRHQAAFARLGKRLALAEYGQILKPYPSCGYTHRIIDCARELRDRVRGSLVRHIRIELPDFHAAILPFMQPGNRREALFSLPFCCAMGLTRGELDLDDLDAERWTDAEVRGLIDKTEVIPFVPARPQLNYDPEEPDRLTVEIDGGEKLHSRVAWPRGAPQNPLDLDAVIDKFRCNAGRLHPPDENLIAELRDWTELDDIHPLFNRIGVTS